METASSRCVSPLTVDGPLEYLTIESYNWPKPSPPNRSRFTEDERRRRHTECQKQFLARKKRIATQLPREIAKLELQLKLVQTMRETEALQTQRDLLVRELAGLSVPYEGDTTMRLTKAQDDDEEEGHLVALVADSLNVDALVAEFGLPEVAL